MAVTEYGQVIFVDTRDVSIAPHLLAWGQWETWITEAISPYLKGSFFVDVGANFGWYSLFAHHREAKKIVSIEPNPRVCELLCQSLAVNGVPCEVHQKAVGSVSGYTQLNFDWQRLCDGSLFSDDREKGGWGGLLKVKNEQMLVEVASLDTILRELFSREPETKKLPKVLKMDAEGSEPKTVMGMCTFFQEFECTLFIEHNPSAAYFKEMLDFFVQAKYSLSVVRPDSKLQPIRRDELDQLNPGEMLCYRRFPT